MDTQALRHYVQGLGKWSEVRVRWRDAYSPASGWHDTDDYEVEDAIVTTVGHVWKNCHEHYLTLCGSVFHSSTVDTVGDINHIPWGMVLDIELVKRIEKYEQEPHP